MSRDEVLVVREQLEHCVARMHEIAVELATASDEQDLQYLRAEGLRLEMQRRQLEAELSAMEYPKAPWWMLP